MSKSGTEPLIAASEKNNILYTFKQAPKRENKERFSSTSLIPNILFAYFGEKIKLEPHILELFLFLDVDIRGFKQYLNLKWPKSEQTQVPDSHDILCAFLGMFAYKNSTTDTLGLLGKFFSEKIKQSIYLQNRNIQTSPKIFNPAMFESCETLLEMAQVTRTLGFYEELKNYFEDLLHVNLNICREAYERQCNLAITTDSAISAGSR